MTDQQATHQCPKCTSSMKLVALGPYASTVACRACGHTEAVHTTVEMMKQGEELRAAALARLS